MLRRIVHAWFPDGGAVLHGAVAMVRSLLAVRRPIAGSYGLMFRKVEEE
jgi:hypothetical protein